MIVLNQSLAQARLWLASNPPARVEKVDERDGHRYTTVPPREWIRKGGEALARADIVLSAEDGQLIATPFGPVWRQSFTVGHRLCADEKRLMRDQALDTRDPLPKALAAAETCALAGAIKSQVWDMAAGDDAEPEPRRVVEDSRTQAQVQEEARLAHRVSAQTNGKAPTYDRNERPLHPIGPATPITREAGWQTTSESPGRFGPIKGKPHTVPPDASIEEHLGLAPGDGLPATSSASSAITNTDEGARGLALSSPQGVPAAGAEAAQTSAPVPSSGEQGGRLVSRDVLASAPASVRLQISRRHDRECATCDTCRGVWCDAAIDEVHTLTTQGVPAAGAEAAQTSAPDTSTDDGAPPSPLASSSTPPPEESRHAPSGGGGSPDSRCAAWCSYECCNGLTSAVATRCGRLTGHGGRHACPTTLDRDPRHASTWPEDSSLEPDDSPPATLEDVEPCGLCCGMGVIDATREDGTEHTAQCPECAPPDEEDRSGETPLTDAEILAAEEEGRCSDCGRLVDPSTLVCDCEPKCLNCLSSPCAESCPLARPTPEQVETVAAVARHALVAGPADLRGMKRAERLRSMGERPVVRETVQRGGGTCPACSGRLNKGDEVEIRGGKRRHVVCPAAPVVVQGEVTP